MRLTGCRAYTRPTPVPKMPPGLVELMEELTRDVLKNNPADVYEFCAGHMRKLLDIRDGPSLKHPLTLEQKIARAQEKVKKRGDARWQKYLKEKEKEMRPKTTLDHEKKSEDKETNMKQSSPTVQTSLKPPVYPDLNTKNSSEIEISHQPANASDLPVNTVQKTDIKNIEIGPKKDTTENGEMTVNIEKIADLVMPASNKDDRVTIIDTEDAHHNTNLTLNVPYYAVKETISNPNKTEIIDEETISKRQVQEHGSAIHTIEEAKCVNMENDEVLSVSPKNTEESKNEGIFLNNDIKILESAPIQKVPPDLEIQNNKSGQEIFSPINNSMTDMEKLVNTAVGVHNVLGESSRSSRGNAEYAKDIDEDGQKGNNEKERVENVQTDVKNADLPTNNSLVNDNESALNTTCEENDDNNLEKSLEKVECSTIVSINNDPDEALQHSASEHSSNYTQDKRRENNEDHHNVTVLQVEEDADKKMDDLKNSDSNYTSQETVEKNIPSNGNHNLESPIIHVNVVLNDSSEKHENTALADSNKVHESSKELVNFKTVDSFASLNGIPVHGEEPSPNVLDKHETQDPNNGNIIEISISQVAEALNNGEPLINEENVNVNMSEDAELCLVSAPEKKINSCLLNVVQNGDDTGEEIEAEYHLHQNKENIDDTPTSITVDNADTQNVKTSDTIKSLSIDESTDGLDNTSLIESGISEPTDDLIQQIPHNNSMDLETAAVTIQKVFRTFLFKNRASTFDDNEDNMSLDEDNEKKDELDFQVSNNNLNKERRGINRMDTVLQTVNEEKSLSLSTEDSSTLSSAATTIQAHVRGFLVRNKLHSHKTASSNSLVNSDGQSASIDGDVDHKNKTILNIHIVPEGGNYLSRDESMLTSMDLSLDGSPPSSLNLHPLGYDRNERRKQLKREDAIQSISPPSNNSGKLSEDVDSVKDMLITEGDLQSDKKDDSAKSENIHNRPGSGDTSPTNSLTVETVVEAFKIDQESSDADPETPINTKRVLTKQSSDEMDVVTPFEDKNSLADSRSTSKLLHSGEFHDIVLPTKVSRSDASVVSEFKNVLVYFLLWNNS